jgi:hypothetical protein
MHNQPRPKQNSPHPGPCVGTSRESVTEWEAQIYAGAIGHEKGAKRCKK